MDSRKASIGGKPVTLDVPARIVGGRTMVPLRFISEALGADVGWDAGARLVSVERFSRLTGVRFEHGQGRGRVILAADGPMTVLARHIEARAGDVVRQKPNPVALLNTSGPERPRIVLDLPNTRVPAPFEPLIVGHGGVRLVRAETVDGPPPTARVVVDLARPVAYEVYGDGSREVIVEIHYELTDVAYRDGEGLLLRLTGPADPKVTVQTGPDRLVVDLPGFKRGDGLAPVTRPGGTVREVRVEDLPDDGGEAPGAGLRVVADLAGAGDYRMENLPEGLLVRVLPQVRMVRWEEQAANLRLTVETSLPARFSVRQGERRGTLEVTVDGATLALPGGSPPAPSGKVTAVDVRAGEDPAEVRLTFSIKDLTDFHVVEGTPANLLVLEATAGALAGKLIVVDAGHGGSDPGAIGPAGNLEKDVTLAVARRLRALLESSGARVLMTREEDRFVGLYDRANLADGAGADLFVSIHSNASDRRAMQGTETYHYPGSEQGRRLAELLHRRLLTALQRPDRGVQGANFVVIREPDMPAALVELAYISNPEEERLLISPEFQGGAAEAIRQGIVDFFRARESASSGR